MEADRRIPNNLVIVEMSTGQKFVGKGGRRLPSLTESGAFCLQDVAFFDSDHNGWQMMIDPTHGDIVEFNRSHVVAMSRPSAYISELYQKIKERKDIRDLVEQELPNEPLTYTIQ